MTRWLGLAVVIVAACGGGAKSSGGGDSYTSFKCYERTVTYSVAGGFAGDEVGVSIECTESGSVKLTKWRTDDDGAEDLHTHPIEQWEFDELWKRIDATGWRHLPEECDNPDAIDGDPVYQFEIADAMASNAMMCEGTELPFPFDRLVNELDLKAAAF
jgi:hypothetical protein